MNLPTDQRMIEERGQKAHWRTNVEMTETSQKPWNRWKFRVSRIPGSLVELLELFFVYHMWHSEQFFYVFFSISKIRSKSSFDLTFESPVPLRSAPLRAVTRLFDSLSAARRNLSSLDESVLGWRGSISLISLVHILSYTKWSFFNVRLSISLASCEVTGSNKDNHFDHDFTFFFLFKDNFIRTTSLVFGLELRTI